MISPKKKYPSQLEKLFEQLENNEKKRIVIIAGKINNRKSRTLTSLYEYKATKQNQNELKLKNELVLIQPIVALSHHRVISDIIFNLKANLTIENFQAPHMPKWIKKIVVKNKKNKIDKMLTDFNNLASNEYLVVRTQSLFPILTTISTLGTSVGVPLLSITLLRSNEFHRFAGSGGFAVWISFCIFLIIGGITALLFYLFSNIRYNKLQRITSNANEIFNKILNKYFVLPENQNKANKKRNLHKFFITTHSSFLYNEIDHNDKNYDKILQLLLILLSLNNNIICTVNIVDDFEIKQLYNPNWGKNNFLVIDISSFKTATNYHTILFFLLRQLSITLNIDAEELFFRSKRFSKIINSFLTEATSNFQLMELLRLTKIFLANFSNRLKHNLCRTFFFDFFAILVLRALSEQNYLYFVTEIQTHFIISKAAYQTIYETLEITKLLSDNWQTYGPNSLMFALEDIYDDPSWLNDIFNSLETQGNNFDELDWEKNKEKVQDFITKRSFQWITETDNHFSIYSNENKEKLIILTVPIEEKNIFEWAEIEFKKALENGFTYVILLFRQQRLILKVNNGKFVVIPETIL